MHPCYAKPDFPLFQNEQLSSVSDATSRKWVVIPDHPCQVAGQACYWYNPMDTATVAHSYGSQ